MQQSEDGFLVLGISDDLLQGIENKIQHKTSATVFVEVFQDLLMAVRQIFIHQSKAQFNMADKAIHQLLLAHFLDQSFPAIVGM